MTRYPVGCRYGDNTVGSYLIDESKSSPPCTIQLKKDDWLPIETAPRDGTAIILWNGLTGFSSTVGVGYWTNAIKYREDLCRADEPASFRWSSDGNKNGMTLATHWMPMPQAPKFS